MKIGDSLKNIQEQAFASWITFLNQLRIDALLEKLTSQDINLEDALNELNELKKSIADEVVNRNRGGEKGMHGFIGERMQVAFKNAKNLIDGLAKEYRLIDDNGRDDYLRNSTPIQQKCVQTNYGVDAIKEHFKKYPDFLEDGGVYQIPKDYYEKLESLWSLSKEDAGKLSKGDYRVWKALQSLFDETGIDPSKIEAMEVDYSEIQKGTYEKTIKEQEKEIKKKDQENRDKAYQKSKPSLKEAGKAAGTGAALEGGIAFCMAVVKKRKEGKKLHDFTEEDWKEIGLDSGKGAVGGGIRGGTVYAMSNFTCTPANVASALVTAVFGTITNAVKYNRGEMSQEDFVIHSEACCLDAGISAISGLLGELVIPVPILGAMVGSAVGNIVYGIAKQYCNAESQKCISAYHSELDKLNEMLDRKYREFVERLEHEFKKYLTILELAFDKDLNIAFDNSILLARMVGVEEDKILKNREEIDNFFLA